MISQCRILLVRDDSQCVKGGTKDAYEDGVTRIKEVGTSSRCQIHLGGQKQAYGDANKNHNVVYNGNIDVNKDLDDARGMKVKAVKHDDNKDVVAENSCVKEELDKVVQRVKGVGVRLR